MSAAYWIRYLPQSQCRCPGWRKSHGRAPALRDQTPQHKPMWVSRFVQSAEQFQIISDCIHLCTIVESDARIDGADAQFQIISWSYINISKEVVRK